MNPVTLEHTAGLQIRSNSHAKDKARSTLVLASKLPDEASRPLDAAPAPAGRAGPPTVLGMRVASDARFSASHRNFHRVAAAHRGVR